VEGLKAARWTGDGSNYQFIDFENNGIYTLVV
jgi:hypothetical protein